MTDMIEIPSDIGRNDACPCGSGKKYKKCHMRLAQAQREAEKQTLGVEQIIGADSIPFAVYDALAQATENNLGALIWEMLHELGPLREQFPTQAKYLIDINEGRATLPAAADYEFMRMRIDEPNAYLLLASGIEDPRATRVSYQLITLLPNERDAQLAARSVSHGGWRIWDIQAFTRTKSELEELDINLAELGVTWHARGLRDYPTHVRVQEEEAAAGAEEE